MAYKDPLSADGLPVTNGFGTTRNENGEPFVIGERITPVQAMQLLKRDVEAAYWPCATTPHWQEMTAHQRAALADLNYNEGYTYGDGDHDTLDKCLRNRNWGHGLGIALQLYDNNDELGLSRRRYAEYLMFSQSMGPKEAYFAAWAKNSVADILRAIA